MGVISYFVKPASVPEIKALPKKIHDYWSECQVPEVDSEGYAVDTESAGRLGRGISSQRRVSARPDPEAA